VVLAKKHNSNASVSRERFGARAQVLFVATGDRICMLFVRGDSDYESDGADCHFALVLRAIIDWLRCQFLG